MYAEHEFVTYMSEHFFANLFAIMYVGMASLTSVASVISEEKEKNTLRVLQMCNVKAFEYLLGNAIYIIAACMLGSLVIGVAGGYTGSSLVYFMIIMFLGHGISVLLGAAIGVIGKNQMVAKFIFSEQLYIMLNSLQDLHIETENVVIIACNAVVIIGVFLVAYRKVFRNA